VGEQRHVVDDEIRLLLNCPQSTGNISCPVPGNRGYPDLFAGRLWKKGEMHLIAMINAFNMKKGRKK